MNPSPKQNEIWRWLTIIDDSYRSLGVVHRSHMYVEFLAKINYLCLCHIRNPRTSALGSEILENSAEGCTEDFHETRKNDY